MMIRTLLRVPKESKVMVVVSLTVLLQVLVLSIFGLAALRGQVAESERNTRILCRRVLSSNLVSAVERRIAEGEEDARRRFAGLAVRPGEPESALARALREVEGSELVRHAFVLDPAGTWYDDRLEAVWPGVPPPPAAAGGDAVQPFEAAEAEALSGGDLDAAIEKTRRLLDGADRTVLPYGLLQLGRLLVSAKRPREALAVYDQVCADFPTARDAPGNLVGPAAARLRAAIRIGGLGDGGSTPDRVVADLLAYRRILLMNRFRMQGDPDRLRYETGRLRGLAEGAARLLPLSARVSLAKGLAAIEDEETSLLALRSAFGAALHRVARGEAPGGRMREDLPGGPCALLALPLRDPGGPAGAVVLEIDVPRIRSVMLPAILTSLPLPGGVRASVVDAAGRPVAGARPGARPVVAQARFTEVLSFWTPVVYLVDRDLAARRTAPARRLHYWIMGLSIAGILAAGWFVLRTVRRELRVARMKSDFLSNVTHELKTPLTSIRMFVETLEEGRVKDEAEREEYLGIISREAERLTELIQRVLDLSRFEKKGAALARKPTDLGELVTETLEVFRRRVPDGRAEVEVSVGPGLKAMRVEPGAVQEMLLNLLGNAVKYGGKHVRVTAERRGREAVIEVADDGVGIAEEDHRRVFEKFYRTGDTLARKVEGTGLGLALVKEIARRHGGRVDLESRKGHGSRFTVRLPIGS